MRTRPLAGLGIMLAMAGCTTGGHTTGTYRQGGSSAVITQEGGGSATIRRTVTGPDGQTIVQRQGDNTAIVRQSN